MAEPALYQKPSKFDPMLCDRMYHADMIRNGHERVWFSLYDSEPINKADPTTRVQEFFKTPMGMAGKTRIRTNMRKSGTLPDPQFFRMWFAGVYLYPMETADPATTDQDLLQVANNTICTLWINDKIYYESLSWDLPGGGGQRVHSYPADLGATSLVWNGVPDQRTLKHFRVPIIIKKNESFWWEIEVDPDAWEIITATAKIYFYVIMHGELFRKIM